MADFYDRTGEPIAYCDDEAHIYFYSGEPVTCLDAGAVYSYRGNN